MPTTLHLPTSTELTRCLLAAEQDCIVDWLRIMEARPDNPFGVTIRQFGQTTALACRKIQSRFINRVLNLTEKDQHHIPAILEFYQEQGTNPVFEFTPANVTPFWTQPNILATLARHGFYQGAFHQLLFASPRLDIPPTPPHIKIEEVGPEYAEKFGWLYEQSWGIGGVNGVLLGQPGFRCYMAQIEGKPAALAVLHVANGVGSMANAMTLPALRGRGCQTALLYHRIREAAEMGCDLLASWCMPGSVGENNHYRVGFQLAASKVWWTALPKSAA